MPEPIYLQPETYDLEHAQPEPDVGFYFNLVRQWRPERIVELGCGTGRITIPLAAHSAGVTRQLVGLEQVSEMLETAREKARAHDKGSAHRLRWVQGDMRIWRDETASDLIIAPCGSLSHLLSVEDQIATWNTTFMNLHPGGRFVVDVAMADFAAFAESFRNPPRTLVQLDGDTSQMKRDEPRRLLRYKTVFYETAQQRASVHYLYDQFNGGGKPERFLSDYDSHVYFPRELELLFRLAGFRLDAVWGDYHQSPLNNNSQVVVMVGQKP